jgi:hypothetical protein
MDTRLVKMTVGCGISHTKMQIEIPQTTSIKIYAADFFITLPTSYCCKTCPHTSDTDIYNAITSRETINNDNYQT